VQWLAVSWTPLVSLLRSHALSAGDWVLVALAVAWPMMVLEGLKVWRGRRSA
jgi:hypothetical protein